MRRSLVALFILTILGVAAARAGEVEVGVALGAKTCGESTCHAAEEPWPNSSVSQREYIVWKERDPHSKAYQALTSKRGQRIARLIGMGDATKAPACLGCHAYRPKKHEATYDIKDGVSCEACHGAASAWLGVHAAGLYFYSENVKNGMYQTTDPAARAELCLDCHVGKGVQFVKHEMMAAGHPPLPFELGFFSWFTKTNPERRGGHAHFTVDDDYLQRKPWPFGVKVWAVGQVVQARKILDLVTDPRNRPKGLFPEPALFDCRSCHRTTKAPGTAGIALPRIKSANLLFSEFAAELVDPALARKLRRQIGALRGSVEVSWGAVLGASRRLRNTLAEIEAKLKTHDYTIEDSRDSVLRIVRAYKAGRLSEYEAAEQAVLGIGSMIDELDRREYFRGDEGAAAIDAMARGVKAFRNNNVYQRGEVRRAMTDIAALMQH